MFFIIKAFQNAWEEVCKSGGIVLIRNGTYLLTTNQFPGPCNGQVNFMVNAIIRAPKGRSDADYWINFHDINGLTIEGNGTFDGQGASAWPYNNCRHAASCTPLSTVSSLLSSKVYAVLYSLTAALEVENYNRELIKAHPTFIGAHSLLTLSPKYPVYKSNFNLSLCTIRII